MKKTTFLFVFSTYLPVVLLKFRAGNLVGCGIQPLRLTHFIEILLVPEFQLTKLIVGAFSYKAHFRPQISSNVLMVCV